MKGYVMSKHLKAYLVFLCRLLPDPLGKSERSRFKHKRCFLLKGVK